MLAVALLGCLIPAEAKPRGGTRELPQEAAAVIQQVLRAAQQREFTRLRALMIREFLFEFVHPSDADAAIEAFKENPDYLRELAAVLKQGCFAWRRSDVTCPGKGGMGLSVGFTLTPDGWRLYSFVTGC